MQPVLTFGLPRRLCLIGRLKGSPLSVLAGEVDLLCGCETLGRDEICTFPAGTVMVEVEVEELGWASIGDGSLASDRPMEFRFSSFG